MMRFTTPIAWQRAVLLAITCVILLVHLSPAQQGPTLPVFPTSFNQTYRDASGGWGGCRMGTGGCSDTIATAGCLITAFAMVLDYYGVALFIPAAFSSTGQARAGMDPGILNDWLRTHHGYGHCMEDEVGNCCLEWRNLPSQIFLSTHRNQAKYGIDPVSQRIIDQALAAGHPVIAGVHWGSHCHGNTRKTEDCHWVVITGRHGTTYTIIDPYNRDSTSRQGVRTTLVQGIFGRYTIDRFVVVSGNRPSSPSPLHLQLAFEPAGGVFHPGEQQRRILTIAGDKLDLLLFSRIIDPEGRIYYAYYPTSGASDLATSVKRHSLYPQPRRFSDGTWEWHRTVLTEVMEGTYTWEIWAEDPAQPGKPLAYDIASYTVKARRAGPLLPLEQVASVGVAAVLAIFVTALVYALILTGHRG